MALQIVIALAIVGAVRVSANSTTPEQDRPTHSSAQAALRYFENVQGADFEEFLRQQQRPAPSPAVRAMVLRNLPKEGELTPTPKEVAKLEGIGPVLAFHRREYDMELRLITLGGMAFVGLHARTVLLISREALQLFETDELIAIMAHELGHDYFWDEYHEARQQRDDLRLQELELRCDGIAVITIGREGIGSERLVSAVTKLARYNQRAMGTPNDPRYVPLDQRVRFIRAVTKIIETSAALRDR